MNRKIILPFILSLLFLSFILSLQTSTSFEFSAKPVKPSSQIIPWYIQQINADDAWLYSNGTGVNLAILDSGIDPRHPDLQPNLAGGISFVTNNPNQITDKYGHGTWVTGIASAVNNEVGLVGVSPDVNIYAIRIGVSYPILSAIIAGIDWCIANDIDIISMSFSSSFNFIELEKACQRASDAGIIMVASAGNNEIVEYPARYSTVIAVGGTDMDNSIPSWSGKGESLELVAPAVEIYSTSVKKDYGIWDGTSASAPQVAGYIALLMNLHPNWDTEFIRLWLQNNAEDLGEIGWDSESGYGLINCEELY